MKKRHQLFFYILGTIVLLAIIITSFIFSSITFENREKENVSDLPDKIQLPGNNNKIYSSLNHEIFEDTHVYPSVSHENVKQLLRALETPSVYYWYYNSSIISSAKVRTTSGIMKYNNGNYMIENYSGDTNGNLEKTVIEENGVVSVQTYNNSQTSISEFDSETTNAFIEAGVPDISAFINSDGENFRYTLHDSEYGKLLYAEFTSEKDGYSQEQHYYISLDFGIVIKAECYENGTLIYALNTLTLYELENS